MTPRLKITPAQLRFLRDHDASGYRLRHSMSNKSSGNYDFVGRVRDLGLIEIDDGMYLTGWPYIWKGTRLTDAGRKAVSK